MVSLAEIARVGDLNRFSLFRKLNKVTSDYRDLGIIKILSDIYFFSLIRISAALKPILLS